MCGFVAAIGRGAGRIEPPRLESMTRTLAHRGPDQEGFFRFYEREVMPQVL